MRSSTFSGILWHQGESDSGSEDTVREYKGKLIKLISDLREDIGCGDIPFVMGELSRDIKRDWVNLDLLEEINGKFYEIADEIPNCAVASSMGLSLKPDGIHFSAPALRVFGRRYFNAYKNIKGD